MKVQGDLITKCCLFFFFLSIISLSKQKTYLKNVRSVNIFSGKNIRDIFCQILNKLSGMPIGALIPADVIREGLV